MPDDWTNHIDLDQFGIILRMEGKTAGERLEAAIIRMKAAKMSDAAIITMIEKDFEEGGRIFGPIINIFTGSSGFTLDWITQAGFGKSEDKKALYTWLTTSGKPCPDCAPRHMQSKTMSEWEALGLPGSGFSVCGDWCMCVLVEKEYVPDDFGEPVEIPPLSEVRKDFKERTKTDKDLQEKMNKYK